MLSSTYLLIYGYIGFSVEFYRNSSPRTNLTTSVTICTTTGHHHRVAQLTNCHGDERDRVNASRWRPWNWCLSSHWSWRPAFRPCNSLRRPFRNHPTITRDHRLGTPHALGTPFRGLCRGKRLTSRPSPRTEKNDDHKMKWCISYLLATRCTELKDQPVSVI